MLEIEVQNQNNPNTFGKQLAFKYPTNLSIFAIVQRNLCNARCHTKYLFLLYRYISCFIFVEKNVKLILPRLTRKVVSLVLKKYTIKSKIVVTKDFHTLQTTRKLFKSQTSVSINIDISYEWARCLRKWLIE